MNVITERPSSSVPTPRLARVSKCLVAFWRKGDKDSDALPGLPSATQGERIEQQLLRGSERDLELEGDTRHRVERVVPGFGWDA